jgi:hypothetical protein
LQIVEIVRQKSWTLLLLCCTAHIWTASVTEKSVGKHNINKNESRLQQILEMLSAIINVFVILIIIIIVIFITGRTMVE